MFRVLALIAILSSSSALAQAPHHHAGMDHQSQMTLPKQSGEEAFATIQEIVEILEADPKTDWSKVNIDALRQHLIDMSNVTLKADAKTEPVDGGARFVVTGSSGELRASIRRMLLAHAMIMNGVDGWKYEAEATDNGANITVRVPTKDVAKLKGMGFMGVMTRGMHHQEHHLMIARGEHPHG
jgi:hypothetical protein